MIICMENAHMHTCTNTHTVRVQIHWRHTQAFGKRYIAMDCQRYLVIASWNGGSMTHTYWNWHSKVEHNCDMLVLWWLRWLNTPMNCELLSSLKCSILVHLEHQIVFHIDFSVFFLKIWQNIQNVCHALRCMRVHIFFDDIFLCSFFHFFTFVASYVLVHVYVIRSLFQLWFSNAFRVSFYITCKSFSHWARQATAPASLLNIQQVHSKIWCRNRSRTCSRSWK